MFEYFTKPKAYTISDDGLYELINQWGDIETSWHIRFLRHHFPNNTRKVAFFGPLRLPFLLRKKMASKKVFYTPEDVNHFGTKLWLYYRDCGLPYVDLGMGFKNEIKKNYLRFPYWITTTFSPESTDDDIIRRIEEINESHYVKSRECVLLCGHDPKGTRGMIYDGIRDIVKVTSAGRWRNNSTELWNEYGNDKKRFMQEFRFNICAENDNTKDYVTEKLFDAFIADCVPIYYGSENNPEPGMLNKEAIIFWEKGKDNRANREKIVCLNSNPKELYDFLHQPKILPNGTEYVIATFSKLKENFARILEE